MSPADDIPEKSGNINEEVISSGNDTAAFAAAFLDLWQRNIAAIAEDPRSGPTLDMIEQQAALWLKKLGPRT